MPPADDPLARLRGRAAFADALQAFWEQQDPPRDLQTWPRFAGKQFDLYVLFEAVRGLGGLEEIADRRRFAVIRDLMLLPPNTANYSSAMRINYERYCEPCHGVLEAKLEATYVTNNEYSPTHQWLLERTGLSGTEGPSSRAISVRDYGEKFATTKSVDPEAKEEEAFLGLPEATQAVIRARLKVSSLEVSELSHPLFDSSEPRLVLLDLRNHIVRLWYRDTRTRLGVCQALDEIPSRFRQLGCRIFTFLECTGVINFGAIPVMPPGRLRRALRERNRKRIAIVGAGMAGLIAARQLRSFGFNVSIFEARERPGGRVHTEKAQFSTGVDMGAMLITGVIQNPVAVLAHQTESKMHFMDSKCQLFDVDGSWVSDEADEWAEKEFNAVLDATARYRNREGSQEKVSKMSLGQAFQKALEKRIRRRKARIQEHISGFKTAIAALRRRDDIRSAPEYDDDENGSYIEIPRADCKRSSTPAHSVNSSSCSPIRSSPVRLRQLSDESDRARKRPRVIEEKEEAGREDLSIADMPTLVNATKNAYASGKCRPMNEKLISRLLRWHIANLEYACAAGIDKVSLRHWDQDDPFGFSGEHVLLTTGYGPLVEGLVKGLEQNLRYESKVVCIQHSEDEGPVQVDVETRDGNMERHDFDSVLVTAPLGVLKRGSIRFQPPLPGVKQEAIGRLGYGGLMKVAMEFASQFWIKHDMFGALRESVAKRGEFYFFWNLVPSTGKPILVAVVAEPCVGAMEKLSDVEVMNGALQVLRRCYPNAPKPKAYSVSRWSEDEFSGGAYTNIPVGSSGDDYDLIAVPVGKSLFFGGEHTCRQYPTTCASAIISGLRESYRLLEAYQMIEPIASIHEGCIDAEDSNPYSSNRDSPCVMDGDDPIDVSKHIPFARKRLS